MGPRAYSKKAPRSMISPRMRCLERMGEISPGLLSCHFIIYQIACSANHTHSSSSKRIHHIRKDESVRNFLSPQSQRIPRSVRSYISGIQSMREKESYLNPRISTIPKCSNSSEVVQLRRSPRNIMDTSKVTRTKYCPLSKP